MNSLKHNSPLVKLLPVHFEAKINEFLELIFHGEQEIPIDEIPIKSTQVYWWGILGANQEILGVTATWKKDNQWHWGRFAIHPDLRGKGYGKVLAQTSLKETFQLDIPSLTINARDIIIPMIEGMGGLISGKSKPFFKGNITPMILKRSSFRYQRV